MKSAAPHEDTAVGPPLAALAVHAEAELAVQAEADAELGVHAAAGVELGVQAAPDAELGIHAAAGVELGVHAAAGVEPDVHAAGAQAGLSAVHTVSPATNAGPMLTRTPISRIQRTAEIALIGLLILSSV